MLFHGTVEIDVLSDPSSLVVSSQLIEHAPATELRFALYHSKRHAELSPCPQVEPGRQTSRAVIDIHPTANAARVANAEWIASRVAGGTMTSASMNTSTSPLACWAPVFRALEMPWADSCTTLAPLDWPIAAVASLLLLSTTMISTGMSDGKRSAAAAACIASQVAAR